MTDQYFSEFNKRPLDYIVTELQKHKLAGRPGTALELLRNYKRTTPTTPELDLLEKLLIKDLNEPSHLFNHWRDHQQDSALYPKGILGLREAVQSISAMQGKLLDALSSIILSPIDVACELSLMVRDDFTNYLALRETIRHSLPALQQIAQCDLIAIELICEIYDEAADHDSARLMGLLAVTQPWQTARIMRTQRLNKTSTFIKGLASRVISGQVNAREFSGLQKTNLLASSYPVLSHSAYRQLCHSLAITLTTSEFADAAGWDLTWSRAAVNGSWPPRPRIQSSKPTTLNIALCVSGQLRGYKEAYATWKHLGLDAHKVDTFVHTWKNIGVRFPDPKWRMHVERRFDDSSFVTKYIQICESYGLDEIRNLYPSLFSTETAGYSSDENTLRGVYGEGANIVIDDESGEQFSQLSNQDKMYYKIKKCFEMVRSDGTDYDLVIRIRPDIKFSEGTSIDWISVHEQCLAENLVFCESRPLLKENVYMGDQIGVSTMEAASIYSNCYDFHDEAKAKKMTGVPVTRLGHTSLAWSLLIHGIKVDQLKPVKWGGLSDVQKLNNAQIREILEHDIGARSNSWIHQELISSLG